MGKLPEGYKMPVTEGSYMKFEDGENKFRVLGDIIVGTEYWTKDLEGKDRPKRVKIGTGFPLGEVNTNQYGGLNLHHFWAMPVWDYSTSQIKVLSITQKTVQKGLEGYIRDEDFGDTEGYDIVVERKKVGDKTEYLVKAKPPKPVAPEILEAFKKLPINMENYYSSKEFPYGGNPFEVSNENEETEDADKAIDPSELPF